MTAFYKVSLPGRCPCGKGWTDHFAVHQVCQRVARVISGRGFFLPRFCIALWSLGKGICFTIYPAMFRSSVGFNNSIPIVCLPFDFNSLHHKSRNSSNRSSRQLSVGILTGYNWLVEMQSAGIDQWERSTGTVPMSTAEGTSVRSLFLCAHQPCAKSTHAYLWHVSHTLLTPFYCLNNYGEHVPLPFFRLLGR